MPRHTPRHVSLSIWLSRAEHDRLHEIARDRARVAGLVDAPSLGAVVRSLIPRPTHAAEVGSTPSLSPPGGVAA